MAITRAQQYRQMLENGGRGISLQEAKDTSAKRLKSVTGGLMDNLPGF